MSGFNSLPPPGTLAYMGQISTPFIQETRDPTVSDTSFPIPTIWVNTSTSSAFIFARSLA